MTDELHLNQRFESYEAFRKCLDCYEKKYDFQFSIKNSQTIEKCKVKGPFKPGLVYYERHYRCQFAGEFKSKGAGIRNCRTMKTGCLAEIKLRARDKKYLEITKFVSEHNHVVQKAAETYQQARPELTIDESQENPADQSPFDPAAQQENLCELLDIHEESSSPDPTKFDIKNLSVVVQTSELEMSDEPIASCSAVPTAELASRNVAEVLTNSISNTADSPESPVTAPYDSDKLGEDLIAVLNFIDELKATPSNSSDPEAIETTEESGEMSSCLVKLSMPTTRKGKGCPKGARLTAIGLPKRKNMPLQFFDKKESAKARDMLSWLFSEELQVAAYSGEYLLSEDDVNSATHNLTDAFNDEDIDINIIKTYFEANAFELLHKAVKQKKELGSWTCSACSKPILDDDKITKFCIMCDSCLTWNHSQCVGLSRKPRSSWFCNECSTN